MHKFARICALNQSIRCSCGGEMKSLPNQISQTERVNVVFSKRLRNNVYKFYFIEKWLQ
jgi:hypothetical protein